MKRKYKKVKKKVKKRKKKSAKATGITIMVTLQGVKIEQGKRQKCEVWSRVMGYHRPVGEWNIGKQQEHKERKHFKESK